MILATLATLLISENCTRLQKESDPSSWGFRDKYHPYLYCELNLEHVQEKICVLKHDGIKRVALIKIPCYPGREKK